MTPKFDPSKPFEEYNPEASAPVFDPSKPFEDVEDESFLPSLDTASETAQDFLTGASQGATLGGGDEFGGGIAAGIETVLGKLGIGPAAAEGEIPVENLPGLTPELRQRVAGQTISLPTESFIEKYRGYQQAGEQQADLAKERSPYAELGGQLGGAILSSTALGLNPSAMQGPKALFSQIAKNKGKSEAALALLRGTVTSGSRLADAGARGVGMFAKASPALAAESALVSKSDIIGPESDLSGVASDVKTGLSLGLPAMMGLNLAVEAPAALREKTSSKLDDVGARIVSAFQDEGNPRLRQMARAYQQYGKNLGIHPRSHADFRLTDQVEAKNIHNTFSEADDVLGAEVGDSIEKATRRGAIVNITPDIEAAANRIIDLTKLIPSLGNSRKTSAAYDKILNRTGILTPKEAKVLIDDLDASIGAFKSATNRDVGQDATLQELFNFRKSVSDTLKKDIPEYRESASRFESLRRVFDQIASGRTTADVSGVYYGKLNKKDKVIEDKLLDMIQNIQRPADSAKPYREAFENFQKALDGFEMDELERIKNNPNIKKVLPSAKVIRQSITNAADDSALRGSSKQVMDSRSVVPDMREIIIGKAPTSGAYLAGRAVKAAGEISQKPIVKKTVALTRAVYNAPAQSVANLASKLEASGNFSQVGKALRESLEIGDTAKKNAALFTIMQNPNTRAFISAEDFPDSVEKEE